MHVCIPTIYSYQDKRVKLNANSLFFKEYVVNAAYPFFYYLTKINLTVWLEMTYN